MQVEFVSVTQPHVEGIETAEDLIVYIARVSNPSNQHNVETGARLLQYLIKNKHWSPFEMVNVCYKIVTSRAIGTQLLRHRSFTFQEFSQRYAEVSALEPVELRQQATENRQSSTEVINDAYVNSKAAYALRVAQETYQMLIEQGVAKEVARMVLPMATQTTLYMNGSLRSWIHFLAVRDDAHAQKEIQQIAQAIKADLKQMFPVVAAALEW